MLNKPFENILTSLTQNEATVLYWKCQGLKHEHIATRLNFGVDWVQTQMSSVYAKLGFSKKMHWSKRVEILDKEVCPIFRELIQNDPENIKTKWPPDTEEPKVDPEMLAIVLVDDKQTDDDGPDEDPDDDPPVIKIPSQLPPPPIHPIVRLLRLVVFTLVALGIIFGVGYLAFRMGQGTVIQAQNQISLTDQILEVVSQLSETPLASETLLPSATPFPSATVPASTATIRPTETLVPTATPNPNVLFFDFTNGLDSAWTVVYGEPVVVNDELTANKPAMISIGDPSWKDYQIELDLRVYACNLQATSDAIGIRASDMNNMLLYLIGSCDTLWYYVIDGEWDSIPNTKTRGLGQPMALTIRVEGNKITVDNKSNLVMSFIDNTFQTGNIFLRLEVGSQYDNIKITLLNQ